MKLRISALLFSIFLAAVAAQPTRATLLSAGYTQDFNSMGTAGTTPPTDWSIKNGEAGTSNTTWSTTITANGAAASVASMVNPAGALTVNNAPTTTNNNGYNAANPSDVNDRVLATSPTGVSGAAIQLLLTNGTGGPVSSVSVGYDIRRYSAAGTANELPGYELFYSLDSGTSWANVSSLNPTLSGPGGVIVPNSAGVTTVPLTSMSLSGSWNDGANLLLRWVDDNAVQTSPDQIIGLDNVTVSVPEPNLGLAAVGLLVFAGARRARKIA